MSERPGSAPPDGHPLAPPERFAPEDFVVDEIPAYAPTGEGGHTFVRVEKRGRTTEQVARELARLADATPRDVGYAGRKDRHATTTQWFSVPDLPPETALGASLVDARVLEAVRHTNKLRTGHLRGNRFTITLHGVSAELADAARERLGDFERSGFANRFGTQRYGRDGDNVERGLAILRGEARPRDRREARFLLSALQSAVFDATLRERALPLDAVERGEVAAVEGSGGLFVIEDEAAENARAARFEISATGPIFGTRAGTRDPAPTGAPGEREREAMKRAGVAPDFAERLPRGVRLPGARRRFRARPGEPLVEHEADRIRLHFSLPPGSYATVLLEELARSVG